MIEKKIFIGGCDRSGTTLLASMLASIEGCVATPESQFKSLLIDGADKEISEKDRSKILDDLKNNFRFRIWLERKGFTDVLSESIKKSETKRDLLESIVSSYALHGNPVCWVDHTPSNIQSIFELKETFPEAVFIHIVRDGRAVASSVLPLPWGPNTTYHAADWWAYRVSFGCAAEIAWPERVHRVSYESLVMDPENTLQELCKKINLTYNPIMLTGSGFALPTYTKKQHGYVGDHVKLSQVDNWKNRLSERDIAVFEAKVSGLLYSFDYKLHCNRANLPRFGERLKINIKELIGVSLNMIKQRSRVRKLPRT